MSDSLKLALSVMEELSCPRSLTVAILLRYEEYDQLTDLKTDPLAYNDPEAFASAYQASTFLKKYPFLPTSVDKDAVASQSWYESESACYKTNERLSPYLYGAGDCAITLYIENVKNIVKQILGSVPKEVNGRFGPGVCVGVKGARSTIAHKIQTEPTITPDAWVVLSDYSETAMRRAQLSAGLDVSVVPGNTYATVPKDSTKNRSIGIEPAINVYYQLAYGSVIRKRLRKFGIDLDNGQDVHRVEAQKASISGLVSTIDLSSASDTISKNLVKLLLPSDWFEVLDALRSKKTLKDGRYVYLEKFSSMGNGFTFELETLIFFALLKGLDPTLRGGENLFVYGDDIIIPTAHFESASRMLEYFGFSLNWKKSFSTGYFRESCGGDYFNGVDVRPYFHKDDIDAPEKIIKAHNGLQKSFKKRPIRSNSSLRYLLGLLPVHIRNCRGPSDLGDLCLHYEEDWSTRERNSIRYIRCYVPVVRTYVPWRVFSSDVTLATALYLVERRASESCAVGSVGLVPRNPRLGYQVKWVPFS